MATCKTLVRTSMSNIAITFRSTTTPIFSSTLCFSHCFPSNQGGRLTSKVASRPYVSFHDSSAMPAEPSDSPGLDGDVDAIDNVEELLTGRRDDVAKTMKMERRCVRSERRRWFPYLDQFLCGAGRTEKLTSGEVIEAMEPHIMESRMKRFRNVVRNRSYSVCLVVEGLSDFGNVSATFRSADALGFQSVHVVSCDSSKRYRENRHVSMGAEKWLDIEIWDSIKDCFEALKSRGYRIATTHMGTDAVSVYDMDWSCPTAIVVGNESKGVSVEALGLSDMYCSIPMNGMVDSFNVSVAAGIVMHQAVCDRTSRMGCHGDLTLEESQILLAEFSLRHNRHSIRIANEYAKRKAALLSPKL